MPLKQTNSIKEKACELESKKRGLEYFRMQTFWYFSPGKHPWNEIQDSSGNEVSQDNASNLDRDILH